MRRIYEDNIDYYTSLKHLINKCFKPKFLGTITLNIIEQVKSRVDKFDPVKRSKSKKRKQNKPVSVKGRIKAGVDGAAAPGAHHYTKSTKS